MRHDDAVETLRSVETARHETRNTLRAYWFPLVLFGVLSVVSAPLIAVFGGTVLAVYWPVVGVLGGIATARHYYRREHALGLEGHAVGHVLTAAGVVVGASVVGFTAGSSGNEMAAAVGPMMVVAVGYAMFAWLNRSIALGLLAAGLAVVAVWLWGAGATPDTAAIVLAVAFGVATGGLGVAQRLESTPAWLAIRR